MPISKSAKKAYVSSERKRARNLQAKTKLKNALKKADAKNINETISLIDKAAKNHLIAKNKASRLKSQLAKKYGTPKKTIQKACLKAKVKNPFRHSNDNEKSKKKNIKTKNITTKEADTKKPVATKNKSY